VDSGAVRVVAASGKLVGNRLMTKYFEDFEVGERTVLGSVEITEEWIIEFAREYDPQPFHTDRAAAASTLYGGLIASGWQTCAIYMRLLYDGMIADSSSMGSSGIDELRWLAPVRPGDTLTATYTVEGVQSSQSRPNRGSVMFLSEMTNQDDVVVLSMRGRGLYGRRPADPADG
jgi:acyl dehydratase